METLLKWWHWFNSPESYYPALTSSWAWSLGMSILALWVLIKFNRDHEKDVEWYKMDKEGEDRPLDHLLRRYMLDHLRYQMQIASLLFLVVVLLFFIGWVLWTRLPISI
jgi:hypothetical protein